MLPISVFFASFLLLGNLSLALNDVGFCQLAKIMTPTVGLLNFLLFGITISRLTLCLGVQHVPWSRRRHGDFHPEQSFRNLRSDSSLHCHRAVQIWIGKKITDLKVDAPQLLFNQAPVSAGLLVSMPFIDTIPDFTLTAPRVLYTLLGPGILANLLNLGQCLIIGRTSTLTFQSGVSDQDHRRSELVL